MGLANLLEVQETLPVVALVQAVLVVQQAARVEAAMLADVATQVAEVERTGVVATLAQAVETEEMELEDVPQVDPAVLAVADVLQAAPEELVQVVALLVAREELAEAEDAPLQVVTLVLAVQHREEGAEDNVFCVRKESH